MVSADPFANITVLNKKFNQMTRKREIESANKKWFGSAAYGTDKSEAAFTREKYEEEIMLLDSIEECFRQIVAVKTKNMKQTAARVPKTPRSGDAQ